MSWAKLDDGFWMHPKVVRMGNEAAGIFARCLSYCGAYLTDGAVPAAVAVTIAGSEEKVEALVVDNVLDRLPSGDLHVRDYLDYNPSSDEVSAEREKRKERAQKGAAARWGAPRKGQ